MRLEQVGEAFHRRLEADRASRVGKIAVEIMIKRLQVRLVERDVPARRRAAEILRQRAEQIAHRALHKDEKVIDRLGLQPRIEAQPRRPHEMMQRDDRLESVRAAIGDPLRIAVERALVEGRRLLARREALPVAEHRAGLHPRPFDAHAEGIQPHVAAAAEILVRQRPEIGSASRGHHIAVVLGPSPVVERFAGAVVAALGLVTRRGDAPEKIPRSAGTGPATKCLRA